MVRIPSLAPVLFVALVTLSCVRYTFEPLERPDYAALACADPGAPADVGTEACPCLQSMIGRAFLFTRMHASEPAYPPGTWEEEVAAGLRELLNDMWKTDIKTHVMNMIFIVKDYDPATGRMLIDAGSAWRQVDGVPCGKKDPAANCPGSRLYMLDGFVSHYVATVTAGCRFESLVGSVFDLFFHTGSVEDPVLCAPDLPKKDAIPMSRLLFGGEFTENCTKIEADLSGCITQAGANGICMCILGDCKDPPPDPTSDDYCQRECGPRINFGINMAGLPLSCDSTTTASCTGDACDAWTLTGDFSAVLIDPDMLQQD